MGRITLVDPDTVSEVNLGVQGFSEGDIDKPKVDAVEAACLAVDSSLDIQKHQARNTPRIAPGDVVFCCVDSISARRATWNAVHNKCKLFIDGRMSGEFMRVLSIADPVLDQYYMTTLFKQEEAHVGRCTARSTVYCAYIASGVMVSQLAKWTRKMPVDRDLYFNLTTMDLSHA